MPKPSPLQRVRQEHGSKAELATKVAGFLEVPEDEEKEDFEHRIATMSNQKLLRLWDAQQALVSSHGSREALADKITKARFPGGNADYLAKISGFSTPKLLDLARQTGV